MTADPDYLTFPNDDPVAESDWLDENKIFNSIKFIPPFLLIVKILGPLLQWDEYRIWSTYVYKDLAKALEHINKKYEYEHRLYLLNNFSESSQLSLIRSIRRKKREDGTEELVFKSDKTQQVLACRAPETRLEKESLGGDIYFKAYPPGIAIFFKD